MNHGEDFGAFPDWYPLIRAARYLGVPAWELAKQHPIWISWALDAELAEPPPTVNARLVQ